MHRPAVVRVAYYRGNDPCSSCQLRAQSVCNAMQDYDLARLAAFAVEREFKIGETFIEEGEPALDSFTVTRGTVKLFKLLPDGCQQVTGFARVGHFLGLAAPDGYASGAQALEAVSLCRFSRSKLRMLLQDSPALENRLLQIASTELVAAQEQMMLLRRKTARERLATFLVMRCRQSVCSGLLGESVSLPMSRGEIADYLGITIETVSRTFSSFKADRRITIPSNREIVILGRAWLEDLAAGGMEAGGRSPLSDSLPRKCA
jgi:CRP/FNR family transcriptional regulator